LARATSDYEVAGTFIDYVERFDGTSHDYAAGIAAHMLRRWKQADNRDWFVLVLRTAADMVDGNRDVRIPTFELPRTTVRQLKSRTGPVTEGG